MVRFDFNGREYIAPNPQVAALLREGMRQQLCKISLKESLDRQYPRPPEKPATIFDVPVVWEEPAHA